MRKQSLISAVVAALAASAVAGGIAWAAIPDSTDVIHGCYSSATGSLRVIDTSAGDACKSKENVLDWNQQGPAGPPGADAATLWAAVDGGGHLLKGKGAVSSTGSTVFPGVYSVTFDRDVQSCALSATIGSYGVSGKGEITAFTYTTDVGRVGVVTRTASDDLAGGTATSAEPFFIAVLC
jgi:hypothetical protein